MMKNLDKNWLLAIALAVLSACGDTADVPPVGEPQPGAPEVGGCVPLDQPIPFEGNNVVKNYANLVGGMIPPNAISYYAGQPVGEMHIGGPGVGGRFQNTSYDGNISLDIQPVEGQPDPNQQNPYYYNPYTNQTSYITGVINISPATQQEILREQSGQNNYYNPYYNPYNPYGPYGQPNQQQPDALDPASVCVSGIAIDSGIKENQNMIYNTVVYLYLNDTQNGVKLYFGGY